MGYVRKVPFSVGVLAIASMSLAVGCKGKEEGKPKEPAAAPSTPSSGTKAADEAPPTDPQVGTVDDAATMYTCMEIVKGTFACMDDPTFIASVDAKQLDALRPLKGDVAKDSGAGLCKMWLTSKGLKGGPNWKDADMTALLAIRATDCATFGPTLKAAGGLPEAPASK